MTLRWRLTLFYTALTAVLLTLIAAGVYAALRGYFYNRVDADLAGDLHQARADLGSVNLGGGQTGSVVDWSRLPESVYGQVDTLLDDYPPFTVSRSGSLSRVSEAGELIQADIRPDTRFRQQLALARRLDRPRVYTGDLSLSLGDTTFPVRATAGFYPQPCPLLSVYSDCAVAIYVARDLRPVEGALGNLRLVLVVVTLLGTAAGGIGSYYVAARALAPLREVRQATARVTERNLSLRVPEPNTHDEVDGLAKALNGMLDRLEASFEAQRRFTADASHELRTPVTAIGGHASYLLRRTDPSPRQRESLEIIRSEGDRLSRLVGDLLDLARADAGLVLEPSDLDLIKLAEDVHREVAPIAGDSEIEIHGPSSLTVRADPNRLRQVLLNLVQNAIKAGSRHVYIGADREAAGRVRLFVEDDGPGIPPEHLGKLFDRFYRVDTARDRTAGGSGLGLSIVRRIVEAHGGTVGVSSRVGVGTRFDVLLPGEPPARTRT